VFVRHVEERTSPYSLVLLEHGHGAVSRVPADATAFPIREHAFDFVVNAQSTDPSEDGRHIAWARAFYESMLPWSSGLVYVNTLSEDEGGRVSAAYGTNMARLSQVKAMYDPENRFRRNHNVPVARVGATMGSSSTGS
jgi:hypothetical protein